jgi:cohesin complex subunit SCC1
VHLLRQHFAPDYPVSATEPPSPSQRTKTEAFFTDLCPEATTSKQDATKLFFEMLVLGTKDAIKVDQSSEELGGPIRVRGKRGLWGDWAEMGESQAAAAVVEGEGEGEAVAV